MAKEKVYGSRDMLPRLQKVNRNHYLVIPKAAREKLNLKEDDWVAIDVQNGKLIVKKIVVKDLI